MIADEFRPRQCRDGSRACPSQRRDRTNGRTERSRCRCHPAPASHESPNEVAPRRGAVSRGAMRINGAGAAQSGHGTGVVEFEDCPGRVSEVARSQDRRARDVSLCSDAGQDDSGGPDIQSNDRRSVQSARSPSKAPKRRGRSHLGGRARESDDRPNQPAPHTRHRHAAQRRASSPIPGRIRACVQHDHHVTSRASDRIGGEASAKQGPGRGVQSPRVNETNVPNQSPQMRPPAGVGIGVNPGRAAERAPRF